MPAKNPLVNGETFPTPTPPDVSYLDFEDIGERISNLLSLALFVERARHLTGELEAAADRNDALSRALTDRDIAYADAYFQLEESLGLQALLRHAQDLAMEAKAAGMALAMSVTEEVTR